MGQNGARLTLGLLALLAVLSVSEGQSYYEKYGPGARDRGPARPPPSRSGSRYDEYDRHGRPAGERTCPISLNQFDNEMDYCMTRLNTLPKGTSMRERCIAYSKSEPCVDALLSDCSRDNLRIDTYKSMRLKKWKDMEREAEVYGVCANYL